MAGSLDVDGLEAIRLAPVAHERAHTHMFAKLTRNLVLALGLAGLAACASSKGATAVGGLKIVGDHIELDDAVYFETGKADIMSSSHALLDRVAEVIKAGPDVGSVEIQGHTDNTGDAAANQALS